MRDKNFLKLLNHSDNISTLNIIITKWWFKYQIIAVIMIKALKFKLSDYCYDKGVKIQAIWLLNSPPDSQGLETESLYTNSYI